MGFMLDALDHRPSNNRGRFLPQQYPSRSKKVQEFLEEPRARTRCCFCCLFLGVSSYRGCGGIFFFPFFSSLHRVGETQGGKKKVVRKGGKKTADLLMEMMRADPKITLARMVENLGISRSAIQKHIARLKDAQLIRLIGPDKGGHWEVIG